MNFTSPTFHLNAISQSSSLLPVEAMRRPLLCQVCYRIVEDILNLNFNCWKIGGCSWQAYEQEHLRTFTVGSLLDLASRAREGCKLCAMILQHEEPAGRPESSVVDIVVTILRLMSVGILEIHLSPDKGVPSLEFEIYTPGGLIHQNDPPRAGLGDVIYDRPDTLECFNLAKSWLQKCVESHEKCSRPTNPQLPTRVIDVGSPDGSQNPFLFVSGGRCGIYATLSHCWGTSERLVTTKSNIAEFQRQIPLSAMAATFQDAVLITRELSIRYLWIDCFCIIQDSNEDWVAEAAQMVHVYENSLVTIAALEAKDSNEGILCNRLPPIWPLDFSVSSSATGGTLDLQLGIRLRQRLSVRQETFSSRSSCLESRAWAFQEQVLSTALLKYTKFDIRWECNSASLYEGNSTPRYERPAWFERYSKGILLGLEKVIREASPEGYFFIWCIAVRLYSEKDLTVKTDRLTAISGIANLFRRAYGTTPLPGLWLEDLHRGLLWFRSQKKPCEPQIGRRVPTWSWVSVDSSVSYFGWHHFGTGDRTLSTATRLKSPWDADIVDAKSIRSKVSSREGNPGVHLYIKGLLRRARFMAHPEPKYCGAGTISAKRGHDLAYLAVILDTDILPSDSLYCLRIATWGYEVSMGYLYPSRYSVRMGFYLLLERAKPLHRSRHPSDWGEFRRVGIGCGSVHEVDRFFGVHEKKFLILA
jgi:Heterokaryon incompatibility protein (HET)